VTARLLALALVAVTALGGVARADGADDEAKRAARQVLIVLRVLAYDKALAARAPGAELTIVVVSGATRAAREDRARWVAGFALLPKVKVGGRAVRVRSVDYGSEAAFARELNESRPGAVIVGDGLAADLPGLRRATRAAQALTFTVREADVRAGLAVGIVPAAERDEIAINLEAARAEGAKLSAGLLQLARLLDSAP
jgi:hypothetical protein